MSAAWAQPGLIIAAPRSGAGKTTVALGLMRAFTRTGIAVQAFKNGPDYIDPAFHARATGAASFNLDSWAMPQGQIAAILAASGPADLAIAEGSMGLFDGAAEAGASGHGATADIAALTGWPVILVLDVGGQAQSAAAVALGCMRLRADIRIAGAILNRVASPRHEHLVRQAFAPLGLPVLGALYRDDGLHLPERHLGLVQAEETAELAARLDHLADALARALDLDALRALARPTAPIAPAAPAAPIAPAAPVAPGQRIALARDAAFSFIYPHILAGWRQAGAEIVAFSPLADEAPPPDCDCCWLPGGYPELHAGRLAQASAFRTGLERFARSRPVHGECGGYMVLGEAIEDGAGAHHAMVGLLGLVTSFARRKLHLGYRQARLLADCPLGPLGAIVRGHEFHYSTIVEDGRTLGRDAPLTEIAPAADPSGMDGGSRRGLVSGTFFHLISVTPPPDP